MSADRLSDLFEEVLDDLSDTCDCFSHRQAIPDYRARFAAELARVKEALNAARDALPDYAHPSLDATRSGQIARVGVLLDAALGDDDARAVLAAASGSPEATE